MEQTVKWFKFIQQCNIREMGMLHNDITSDGAKNLFYSLEINKSYNFTALNISRNRIGDEAIPQILWFSNSQ